jgi:hypothetical protein
MGPPRIEMGRRKKATKMKGEGVKKERVNKRQTKKKPRVMHAMHFSDRTPIWAW